MVWSKAFFLSALENAATTGIATFAASNVFTAGPSAKGFIAAGIAAGMGALYAFVKQVGGVQATKLTVKVKAP